MYNRTHTKRLICGAVAILLAAATGCQTNVLKSGLNPFQPPVEEETPQVAAPTRMAVIWKETAVSPGRGTATRGFGGRVYFYNNANEPVRADGELTVYAFDDTGTNGQPSNVPDRKYVFHAEDMDKHFSETELGPSYSVWLPWDKVGGMRKTIALMPVFKPVNGRIVQSGQSIAVLPGKNKDNQIEDFDNASMVRQVNATVPAGQRDTVSRLANTNQTEAGRIGRPRTTTIRVPRSMASRMKGSGKPLKARPPTMARRTGNHPASYAVGVGTTPETTAAVTETPSSHVFGQPGSWR